MIRDRVELELPHYDGLLASRHHKEPGYVARRTGGTDDWVLVATIGGTGRIATGQVGMGRGEAALPTGSLLLIAPGTPHDYGTARGPEGAGGWEILWVHFHPPAAWLEWLAWPSVGSGVSVLIPSAWSEIVAAFEEVVRLSLATGRRRREFAMNALERLLLLGEAAVPGEGPAIDPRLRTVVAHIDANLGGALTLARLGDLVGLSPSRLAHLFRAGIGLAPLQYVGVQRMERAQTLLRRTTLSVTEIAAEVGMEPFHFSARFRTHAGLSPRAYRRAGAGD